MHSTLNCSNPEKHALVVGEHGYTYSQVDVQIQRFASGILAGASDLKEDRIAFLIPASLEYVTTMLGLLLSGGIAITPNPGST